MTRCPTLPGLLAALWLAWPAPAAAQPGRRAVAEGNRLYDAGRYDEAHERYLDALREAPDSAIAPFNDGNALYRTDEFQRAGEAYRQAAETGDPAVTGRAWYNLGNALYRQQQLEAAVEAYKEALRRDPTDVDAKHNLEVAYEQLEQQQRQQPQQNDQDQDQQDGQPEEQRDQQDQRQQDGDRSPPDEPSQPEQAPDGQAGSDPGDPPQDQAQPAQGDAPAQEGALSREEAERLLEAVDEDPSRIQRQRRTTAPARPPGRPW